MVYLFNDSTQVIGFTMGINNKVVILQQNLNRLHQRVWRGILGYLNLDCGIKTIFCRFFTKND